MPVRIKGVAYFRTAEALREAGISRATFFRWLAVGRIADSLRRDRNGRRLFTRDEIKEITEIASRIQTVGQQTRLPFRSRS